jgi:hypothetical protein
MARNAALCRCDEAGKLDELHTPCLAHVDSLDRDSSSELLLARNGKTVRGVASTISSYDDADDSHG